jgi:lysyl-tRNA synthetase class 2
VELLDPDVLAIVAAHGIDTLSFFKLRLDVDHLITPDGSAMLGYAEVGRTLLVAGDPVAPAEAVPPLLAHALAHARERRLRLAVLGASERTRPALAQAGLRCMYVGDEAIVELAGFSTGGSAMRKLRKPANRLAREGHGVEVRRLGEVADAELAELEALSHRALGGRPERSFAWAMDSLRGEHQADCIVVIGRDPEGAARGMLHLVPSYGGRAAWSVSMMRRDPQAANGLMDVLVLEAIAAGRAEGIEELSLNFAAFSRWLREPSGVRERAGARAVRLASRWIQMETLLRFNQKFRPRWDPRYLAYEGRLGFVRAGLAAMRVEGQVDLGRQRLRARSLRSDGLLG